MQTGAPVPNNRGDEGFHFQWEFSLKFQEWFDPNQALLEGEREKWGGGVSPVQTHNQSDYSLAGALLRFNTKQSFFSVFSVVTEKPNPTSRSTLRVTTLKWLVRKHLVL